MNTKPPTFLARRLARLAPLIATPTAIACGGDSAKTPSESVGKAVQADQVAETFTMDSNALKTSLDLLDPWGATAGVQNGSFDFAPSSGMIAILSPDKPSALAVHIPVSSYTDSFDISLPWPLPDITGHFTATVTNFNVDSTSLTVTFDGDHVDMSVNLSGSLHIDTTVAGISADEQLAGTVDMQVSRNLTTPNADALTAPLLAVNITSHSADCGAFDWCGGLADSVISGEVSSKVNSLQSTFLNALNVALSNPDVIAAVEQGLSSIPNQPIFDPNPSGSAWQVVPGSLQFANNQATWSLTHWLAPVAPGCTFSTPTSNPPAPDCTFTAASCQSTGDGVVLQVLDDSGQWVTEDAAGCPLPGPAQFAPGVGYLYQVNARACTHANAPGPAVCDAPTTLSVNCVSCPSSGGSGGGGGGGGSVVGTGGRPTVHRQM